jgi:hypothetical protein
MYNSQQLEDRIFEWTHHKEMIQVSGDGFASYPDVVIAQ